MQDHILRFSNFSHGTSYGEFYRSEDFRSAKKIDIPIHQNVNWVVPTLTRIA